MNKPTRPHPQTTNTRANTQTNTHTHTNTNTHTHTNTQTHNRHTEDACDKAEGELGGEECEEPGGGVETGADLMVLQVAIELPVVVVQQSGQLVHLDLTQTHTAFGII